MKKGTLAGFVKEHRMRIVKRWTNKYTLGICDYDSNEILLNVCLMLVDIMMHEYLHYRYPHLKECQVKKRTQEHIRRTSIKEIRAVAYELICDLGLTEEWQKMAVAHTDVYGNRRGR